MRARSGKGAGLLVLAVTLTLASALAGCTTTTLSTAMSRRQACPVGQERLRMAQLFFGRSGPNNLQVSDAEWRSFVDDELTPRFPDGLTVLDGGGQWRNSDNKLIRQASKMVMIVMPRIGDGGARLDAVRAAYKAKFRQESVLLVTQPACVSF